MNFELRIQQKTIVFLLLVLSGLLVVFNHPATAQSAQATPAAVKSTPSDDQVNAVAKQMFCPVCENIPLDVCPTQACQNWRTLIRQKLADGWTTQQIKDYFAQQYGDRVLAQPPARGLNWLVYILPGVFILMGLVVLWRVLRSGCGTGQLISPVPEVGKPPSNGSNSKDPYIAKLEEELRRQKK